MRKVLPAVHIPGLNDHVPNGRVFSRLWFRYRFGIDIKSVRMDWRHGNYDEKQERIKHAIDKQHEKYGEPVALIGESAGGAPCLHAKAAWPDKVGRVVTICAEINNPDSVRGRFADNPAFEESLSRVPASLESIEVVGSMADLLSLRPVEDPKVPPADTIIDGAENRLVGRCGPFPTRGHMPSIALLYAIGAHHAADFIRQGH